MVVIIVKGMNLPAPSGKSYFLYQRHSGELDKLKCLAERFLKSWIQYDFFMFTFITKYYVLKEKL